MNQKSPLKISKTFDVGQEKLDLYIEIDGHSSHGKLCAGLKENNFKIPLEVWLKNWMVDVQAVGNGKSSLKYPGRYIYRATIS